jgi:hypothetical protein
MSFAGGGRANSIEKDQTEAPEGVGKLEGDGAITKDAFATFLLLGVVDGLVGRRRILVGASVPDEAGLGVA